MKKTFGVILLILIVILIFGFMQIKKMQTEKKEIQKYNLIYEDYNKENLNGLDITTVINKAINSNEKNKVAKDEDGLYIANDENSVKIYITMIINGKTYPMEKIVKLGINSFVEYFGVVSFKCTDIKYHEKTGKVSEMTFEATEY